MEGRSAATDPLILPVAAIVCGILLGRALTFSRSSAAWPVRGVCPVEALALNSRLRRWCLVFLALIFLGAFRRRLASSWTAAADRRAVAGNRHTGRGCVVELRRCSRALPGRRRQQFTLELDPVRCALA